MNINFNTYVLLFAWANITNFNIDFTFKRFLNENFKWKDSEKVERTYLKIDFYMKFIFIFFILNCLIGVLFVLNKNELFSLIFITFGLSIIYISIILHFLFYYNKIKVIE